RDYNLARELLAESDPAQRGWEWNYLHTRLADAPVPGWTGPVTVKHVEAPNAQIAARDARYYEACKHKYASFSPNGKLLACIDAGRKIKLLDAFTGGERQSLVDNAQRTRAAAARGKYIEPFFAVEFSPDNERVAAMSRNRIVVWDCDSGDILWTAGAS